MLGYTFGNLDNEVSFVRNCLTGAEVGDLLLLDAGVAKASADDATQIRAREPVFAKKRSPELMRQLQQQEAFNIGLLLRYRVEDFPLAPEEETTDFQHLTMTLMLRHLRASEHWTGNTQVRLRDIIYRLVEQGVLGGPLGAERLARSLTKPVRPALRRDPAPCGH
jgi:hypothetical protein